jgi:ubiquitin-protein ligase
MNVRLRRLKADYDKMCSLFTSRQRIRILKMLGNPPEKYQVELLVTSLQKDLATRALRTHNAFIAEIVLTAGYPRMAPQCRMLTPVFHPNVAPHAVCIGDHWAAGESLPNLVVRIAEMLAYQSYNTRSPLDGEAARWVEMNRDKLPLDTFDFSSILSVGEAVSTSADGHAGAGQVCANCGKTGDARPLGVCINHHAVCADCVLECPICHKTLCLKCPRETCVVCRRAACPK